MVHDQAGNEVRCVLWINHQTRMAAVILGKPGAPSKKCWPGMRDVRHLVADGGLEEIYGMTRVHRHVGCN